MSEDTTGTIRSFGADDLEPLTDFLTRAFPNEGFTARVVASRVLDDPDFAGPLAIACASQGAVHGLACGVVRPSRPEVAEVKWFGVARDRRRQGIGTRLMDRWEAAAQDGGATKARVGCSVPGYLAPGISTRHTDGVSFLLRRGYAKTRDTTNMAVDLQGSDWRIAAAEQDALRKAKVEIRRLESADADRFDAYLEREWDGPWRTEAALVFRNDPVSGFVAEREGRIVGFAAYDVNQFGNSFGPTGVDPALRGVGVGGVLLKLCLADLRARGYAAAAIGAVGPVPFYHRVAGARISETFWMMEKELG